MQKDMAHDKYSSKAASKRSSKHLRQPWCFFHVLGVKGPRQTMQHQHGPRLSQRAVRKLQESQWRGILSHGHGIFKTPRPLIDENSSKKKIEKPVMNMTQYRTKHYELIEYEKQKDSREKKRNHN